MKRKSDFNTSGQTVRDRRPDESLIEYGHMESDELVEHLIDENGLVAFLEAQQAGKEYERWDWREITLHLQAFSRGHLTFSPEYLKDLYEMQRERLMLAEKTS